MPSKIKMCFTFSCCVFFHICCVVCFFHICCVVCFFFISAVLCVFSYLLCCVFFHICCVVCFFHICCVVCFFHICCAFPQFVCLPKFAERCLESFSQTLRQSNFLFFVWAQILSLVPVVSFLLEEVMGIAAVASMCSQTPSFVLFPSM